MLAKFDYKHYIMMFIILIFGYEIIRSKHFMNNEKEIFQKNEIMFENKNINEIKNFENKIIKNENTLKTKIIEKENDVNVKVWPYPKTINFKEKVYNISNYKDFEFKLLTSPDTVIEKAFLRYNKFIFYDNKIQSIR
jgi:hypothetical protein